MSATVKQSAAGNRRGSDGARRRRLLRQTRPHHGVHLTPPHRFIPVVSLEVHGRGLVAGLGGSAARHDGAPAGSSHGGSRRTVLQNHGAQAKLVVLS